ncbi:putative metal-dependent HD superfamily phosphohydrolase [Methylorubrum extorquens]|nr:putative metal-dependent HD superfamily phosphohydrolase [Methylorubrum extorquens]
MNERMNDRMNAPLRARFGELWGRTVRGNGAEAAWRALDAGYGEAGRYYHGWRHIADLLEGHDAVRALPDFAALDHDAIDLAIFFHDAAYDPARTDNEWCSAALLLTHAGPAAESGPIRAAEAMIRATAAHAPSDDTAMRLMLDLDLAVLGAPRPVYEAYAAAIRREYAAVPEAAWRFGRAGVLERFLARPGLYQTRPLSRPLRNSRPDQPRGRGGHAPGSSC